MAYLDLVDIGKIYASENNVSVGIRNVNLSFDKGEFVAVTGKSGSGKSTLLNVISGMDSYEEGEMYIQGQPTSHYIKEEWEEYSMSYISFIFQNYNILESFSVYENVFFALTSISDLAERKARALEIIKQVGLESKLKTKGSVLSGGEKQRTVIARAIAKDSPIILADEPTGNLDSKNAKEILELLHDISKDKLVIVVTHNFDDIKEYATRHIRIFDGKVDEDTAIDNSKTTTFVPVSNDNFEKERAYIFKQKSKFNKLQKSNIKDVFLLGYKRFSSRPKQNIFITGLIAFALIALFLLFSLMAIDRDLITYFNAIDGRVLVGNNGEYTQEDANALKDKYGANKVLLHDVYLDEYTQLFTNYNSSYLRWENPEAVIKLADENTDLEEGQVIINMPYAYKGIKDVGDTLYLGQQNISLPNGLPLQIVDINYFVNNSRKIEFVITYDQYIAYSNLMRISELYGNYIEVSFDDGENLEEFHRIYYLVNDELKGNEMILNTYLTKKYESCEILRCYINNDKIDAQLKDIVYYSDKNQEEFAGLEISRELFEKLYTQESTQISLFFDNDQEALKAMEKMKEDGYQVILSTNLQAQVEQLDIFQILELVGKVVLAVLIAVVLALMIVLTLSKIMLASRQDVAIFRTMGIKSSVVKLSTYVQLIFAIIPAVIILTAVALICYMTSIGKFLQFVSLAEGFIIVVAGIILVLVLAKVYNKLLYKEKMKKGLRRVNK